MSTVIPNKATSIEENSSNLAAPQHVLKSAYDLVLAALNGNKKIILISGGAKRGKTALLQAICKNIAATNRIINLSSKDLPLLETSNSNFITPELSSMKDFILESTDLDETLVVTLDDADQLPINFIGDLIEGAKESISNGHDIQLILTAPSSYKKLLLNNIEQLNTEEITHCSIDSISVEEIHTYAKDKTYKFSSNIKRLEFKPASLQALADFIQSDKQILDVVLEWCAALAKKDQLTSITPHTVNRAARYAQQFSKDKSLRIADSYPPSHEVYKYINDIQSAKKPSTKTKKKSVKKPLTNKARKPFIKTKHKAGGQDTKIPSITSKVGHKKQEKITAIVDKEMVLSLEEIEDEIMPTHRAKPTRQQSSDHKKSFPAMAGLLSLVVVGFIAFITYRVGSEPEIAPLKEALPEEQIAQHETTSSSQENGIPLTPEHKTASQSLRNSEIDDKKTVAATEPTLADKKSNSHIVSSEIPTRAEKVKQIITKNESAETVTTPHAGIIASDIKRATGLHSEAIANESSSGATLDNKKITTPNEPTNKLIDNKKQLETEAEINRLLALAKHQFEIKQISTPPGDNALDTYKNILAKYPENKLAIAGINKLHATYVKWANYYLQQNEVSRAKNFYSKALTIDPHDSVSEANLQNISEQETASSAIVEASDVFTPQDAIPLRVIQNLLATADQKILQITNDIKSNKRNYKAYKEAQTAYEDVLKTQPQNPQAKQGLSKLIKYYEDWAELQTKSKNYNIALFLYGQALSIAPENVEINQRMEQVRQLKSAAL